MNEALKNHFIPDTECLSERRQGTPRDTHRWRARQMRKLFQLFMNNRVVQWLGTLLGVLWASPLTAFGLLMALPVILYRGKVQIVRGHTKSESPTQEMLRDGLFVMNVVAWAAVVLVIVYRIRPTAGP